MRKLGSATAILGLCAIFLGGCGNFGGAPRKASGSNSLVSYSPLNDEEGKDSAGCPSGPNVVADYDWYNNGRMNFTVCSKPSAYPQIYVKGLPYTGSRICVFPAEQTTETTIAPKPDLASGLPWFKCGGATAEGTLFAFDGIKFNFLFVTAEIDALQMQDCLARADYARCPVYRPQTFSRGRFRQ